MNSKESILKLKKKKYVKEKLFDLHGVKVSLIRRNSYISDKKIEPDYFVSDLTDLAIWTEGLINHGSCELVCFFGPLRGEPIFNKGKVLDVIKETAEAVYGVIEMVKRKGSELVLGSYFNVKSERLFYISSGTEKTITEKEKKIISSIPISGVSYRRLTEFFEEDKFLVPKHYAMFLPAWTDHTLIFANKSTAIN